MDKNALIVKSNALIQTSYRLSTNEQRIILACISQVRRDEPITDKKMYTISAAEFSALCGTNHASAYRDLESAALALVDRKVKITQRPNGQGRLEETLVATWVQSVKYSKGSGLVRLRFNHDLLPYLTELNKNFTAYSLTNIAKMSSSYGVRIYELLLQWLNTGEREISVTWLRETLVLNGKYKQIGDFKKRVLDPAMRDINKHSDIWIEITQRKTGRKVTHIKFKFGLKKAQVQKRVKLTKAHIKKQARPGESYDEVKARLKEKMQA